MEIWKDIIGYEGLYQVSNLGRVKSMARNKDGKVMRPDKIRSGYMRATLQRDKDRKRFLVHRLVATAFIGCPDESMDINHKNSIKDDNRIENLEWVTRKENIAHFRKSKGAKIRDEKMSGLNNPKSKLSMLDIKLIKKLSHEYGFGLKRLSWLFDVDRTVIYKIKKGTHWSSNRMMEAI